MAIFGIGKSQPKGRSVEKPGGVQAWYDAISGRRMDQHLIEAD